MGDAKSRASAIAQSITSPRLHIAVCFGNLFHLAWQGNFAQKYSSHGACSLQVEQYLLDKLAPFSTSILNLQSKHFNDDG
jgi:hypothetical protein